MSSYVRSSGRPVPPPVFGGSQSTGSSYRPVPPSVGGYSRPVPPAVDHYNPGHYRPTPPPVSPYYPNPQRYRPVPPPVDPYFPPGGFRPVPPVVVTPPRYWPFPIIDYPREYESYTHLPYSSNPSDISYNFLRAQESLRSVYDTTSMTHTEYSALERSLVSQAVDQLMVDARGYSLSSRERALRTIYNHSEMTTYEFNRIDRDLLNNSY